MRWAELCEPLFQYLCRVNRSARKGLSCNLQQVRLEVRALLSDIEAAAARAPRPSALQRQPGHDDVSLALMCFADEMIRKGGLEQLGEWRDLAREAGEPLGGQRFWDLADRALADPSDAAAARLEIFCTCIGLGFVGIHRERPDTVRRKMLEMTARLGSIATQPDSTPALSPRAYEHLDPSNLPSAAGPRRSYARWGFIIAAILALLANVGLLLHARHELTEPLDKIPAATNKAMAGLPTLPSKLAVR